ncbi:FAD-binding oxidoreductase [Natronorubrum halophilum]|uniref:FAD-binding oxidoreductase n=1 Tax=Natronorubrum halophilum TaxID=1702106 RepID=UPI0010C19E97|nr:FAD-binding oxidoreductase [Natronorubrum halophilum]
MPELRITRLEDVGDQTAAIEVEAPTDFEAYPGQFVLVRATINGEEETGYYTISSPDVEERFEMTVAVDPDGTLGPWLVERALGETITVEGPFGDIQYVDDGVALVFAGGPGIGPAIGIAERARRLDHDVTIVYGGDQPPHRDRLDTLKERGATIVLSDDLEEAVDSIDPSAVEIYVFGFQQFVEEARDALSRAGIDLDTVEIESFGPE